MSEGKDLTQGNLLKNMVRFCLPILLTNLLNSIYNIVDGIWIGRLVGDSGLAATTNCWPIMLLGYSFLAGVTVATSVLIAQHFTSKNKDKIREIATPLYVISLIMGIFTACLLISTASFWFKVFKTPAEVLDDAKGYISIYLIGYIFDFVAFTMIEAIRATGNSRIPLKILGTTEVLNIILDPIIIKMGFGVRGAAIATAISMCFSVILCCLYIRKSDLLKFNIKNLKLKKDFIKQVSILGIPMIIQQLLTIITIMLEVNVSNSLGVIGSTTYGISSKFQEVVWIIGNSINGLLTVVVAQFIGKKEFGRIKDAMKNGLKIALVPMTITIVFLIFFSGTFARVFTDNDEVISMAINYMYFVGIGYTLVPICQLLYGFVLGIGNTRFSFIVSTTASIVEVIAIIILNNTTHKPFMSLGIGISLWYITEIILFAIYYFSKRWLNKTQIEIGQ